MRPASSSSSACACPPAAARVRRAAVSCAGVKPRGKTSGAGSVVVVVEELQPPLARARARDWCLFGTTAPKSAMGAASGAGADSAPGAPSARGWCFCGTGGDALSAPPWCSCGTTGWCSIGTNSGGLSTGRTRQAASRRSQPAEASERIARVQWARSRPVARAALPALQAPVATASRTRASRCDRMPVMMAAIRRGFTRRAPAEAAVLRGGRRDGPPAPRRCSTGAARKACGVRAQCG
ncbi:hypothetical protein BURC_00278 [Burkholderiaceae bacterium]|nr:hypothetical protein BURC_00278 [Burkholderiaceae bacterium]